MSSQSGDHISSATSVDEIIAALAARGCRDLTAHINWAACSSRPLAGGGFCDVYRGELDDTTQIAIRSLRIFDAPGKDNRAAVLKNAAKELYHWSRLRHQNVLLLMGLAIYRDQISMVSEWVNNGNLSQYLAAHPEADRLALCRDIRTGLHYIHIQGMVHGDLKAGNVMISPEGSAMIADFGNSRLKELTVQFTGTTGAAHAHSLRWAAPELLKEECKPNIHSDIYAYGMTALETFTGEIPYRDLSDTKLAYRIFTGVAKPLRPAKGITDSVWKMLESCWSPKPEARPSLTAIEECLSNQATLYDPGSVGSTVDFIKAVPRDPITRPMAPLDITAGGKSANVLGDEEPEPPDSRYQTNSTRLRSRSESSNDTPGRDVQLAEGKLSEVETGGEILTAESGAITHSLDLGVVAMPSSTVVTPHSKGPSTKDPSPSNSSDVDPPQKLERNAKFKALTRRVIETFRITPQSHPPSPPVRIMSSPSVISDSRHGRGSSDYELISPRIEVYLPLLRTLRSSQLLTEHVALVKHLQFSPDGQFLATCSWDRTALIWRVGAGPLGEFEILHKLVHTSRVGGFVGQVAWSPSGEQLLTRQIKSIKVWSSKTGVCERTIDRKRNVQSITWMPKGQRFMSIEWEMDLSRAGRHVQHKDTIVGSNLAVVGLDGVQLQEHHMPQLQVWNAAIIPDEERLVAVATLLSSEQTLRPDESHRENQILIYNLHTKEIENQVPFSQEVRDITLTEGGNFALVSYENKAPPQAWRIDKIQREGKQRLVLAHTFLITYPVDFAGPSYFGGSQDMLVLAASKNGEIYIWERSSGVLLHSLKAPDQELTNLAWNHKSPSGLMFASAAHDGIVRIWTTAASTRPSHSLAPSSELQEAESPGPLRQDYRFASPLGAPKPF